jgi:hypothetical protein
MDDQFSIAASSLSFPPIGNLEPDFIDIGVHGKANSLREQLDDMKPSEASDNSQHKVWALISELCGALSRPLFRLGQAISVHDRCGEKTRTRQAS